MKFINKYQHLFIALVFTALLLGARIAYTGRLSFAFISWNLFLAVVPLYFSYLLQEAKGKLAWIYATAWLLFFPNTMYIVTDLFHLRDREVIPVWYDLIILFSAAVNGIIAGFASLHNVERWLKNKVALKRSHLLILPLMLLCGYGIYLGRYERWNSWDILSNPFSLFSSIYGHIRHPFRYKECWMLTAIFGAWMSLLYSYTRKLKHG